MANQENRYLCANNFAGSFHALIGFIKIFKIAIQFAIERKLDVCRYFCLSIKMHVHAHIHVYKYVGNCN